MHGALPDELTLGRAAAARRIVLLVLVIVVVILLVVFLLGVPLDALQHQLHIPAPTQDTPPAKHAAMHPISNSSIFLWDVWYKVDGPSDGAWAPLDDDEMDALLSEGGVAAAQHGAREPVLLRVHIDLVADLGARQVAHAEQCHLHLRHQSGRVSWEEIDHYSA